MFERVSIPLPLRSHGPAVIGRILGSLLIPMAVAVSGCSGFAENDVVAPERVQLDGVAAGEGYPHLSSVPDGPVRRPATRADRERMIEALQDERGSTGSAPEDRDSSRAPAGTHPGDVQLAQAQGDQGRQDDRIEINREQIPQMSPSREGEPLDVPTRTESQQNVQSVASNASEAARDRRVAVIQFGHGQAMLSGHDRQVLEKVTRIHDRTRRRLRVVGHSSSFTRTLDPVEHRIANFDMSMKRAEAVANALAAMGVSANAIRVQARGDRDPRYHEFMPSGQAGNRRAEIYLRAPR